MSRNSRQQIVEAALDLVRDAEGRAITLDSVAREVGLSKPGLMYHFPTKRALMLGIVEHVADCWEQAMLARIDGPREECSTRDRIRAYALVALDGHFDRADFAVFTDAAYKDFLTEAWVSRMEPWFAIGDDVPARDRGAVVAARLMADGYWMADATDLFRPSRGERRQLRALLDDLLAEPA